MLSVPNASTTRSTLPAGIEPGANAVSTGVAGSTPAALYAKVSVTATPNTGATAANAAVVSAGTAAVVTVAATALPSDVTTVCAGLYTAVTAASAAALDEDELEAELLELAAEELLELELLLDLWLDLWLLELELVLWCSVPLLPPGPEVELLLPPPPFAANAVMDMETAITSASAVAKYFFMLLSSFLSLHVECGFFLYQALSRMISQ